MTGDSTKLQQALEELERFESQAWRLQPAAARTVRGVIERRIVELGGTPPASHRAPALEDPAPDEPHLLEGGDDPAFEEPAPEEPLEVGDDPLVVEAGDVEEPVFGFDESDAFAANHHVDDLSALDLSLGEGARHDDLTPPRPPRPLLVVHVGTADEEILPLDSGAISLGRGKACGLRIKDSRASREHCRIFPNGGEWWVEDLDSANGTLINGVFLSPNTPQELAGGEELVVGSTVLRFELATGAPELA